MLNQRSKEIETRLADILNLIPSGRCSTPRPATAPGISNPTVTRFLRALRACGDSIGAVKDPEGWACELRSGFSRVSPQGGRRA